MSEDTKNQLKYQASSKKVVHEGVMRQLQAELWCLKWASGNVHVFTWTCGTRYTNVWNLCRILAFLVYHFLCISMRGGGHFAVPREGGRSQTVRGVALCLKFSLVSRTSHWSVRFKWLVFFSPKCSLRLSVAIVLHLRSGTHHRHYWV